MGDAYFGSRDIRKALDYHQKALNILQQNNFEDMGYIASLYTDIGRDYSALDMKEEAISNYSEAIRRSLSQKSKDESETIERYWMYFRLYNEQKKYKEAKEQLEKIIDLQEKNQENKLVIADTYFDLSRMETLLYDDEKALEHMEIAAKLYESGLPPDNHKVIDAT